MPPEVAGSIATAGAPATTDAGSAVGVRRLGPPDREAAAAIASSAFRGNRFYEAALGLDAPSFDVYWDLFFALALGDPAARVFGIEAEGELVGAAIIQFRGFPAPSGGARFIWRLVRRLRVGPVLRYLRFLAAYERAMRLPAAERRLEARGLWIMVRPDALTGGLGSRLVREIIEAARAEGKTIYTAFIDARDPRIVAFYRRAGFSVGMPFPFAGGLAAKVERREEAGKAEGKGKGIAAGAGAGTR